VGGDQETPIKTRCFLIELGKDLKICELEVRSTYALIVGLAKKG
jgi:hypothetical protein